MRNSAGWTIIFEQSHSKSFSETATLILANDVIFHQKAYLFDFLLFKEADVCITVANLICLLAKFKRLSRDL